MSPTRPSSCKEDELNSDNDRVDEAYVIGDLKSVLPQATKGVRKHRR